MSWRDRLRTPSFRGVPFHVESSSLSGGRRLAVHEYPQQDKPYAEDMGRKGLTVALRGVVVGDEYFFGRDLLLEALETPGTGTLIHPHYGEMTVSVDSYDVVEDSANGRIAIFDMSFVESGDHAFPVSFLNPASVTDLGGAALVAATIAAFVERYNLSAPAWVLDAAATKIGALVDTVRAAVLGPVSAASAILADVDDALDSMAEDAATLAGTPQDLADDLAALLADVTSIGPDAVDSYRQLTAPAGAADVTPIGTTAAHEVAAANETAFDRLLVRLALGEVARAIAAMTFTSYDAAIATRDTFADRMAAEDAAQSSEELAELRCALVEDLTARAEMLARLRTLTPTVPLPAALLAYQLYGDARRGDEIADRNRLAHPSFVPISPLWVLSR